MKHSLVFVSDLGTRQVEQLGGFKPGAKAQEVTLSCQCDVGHHSIYAPLQHCFVTVETKIRKGN